MWDNFFKAGGWGMYPVMVFGFLLLATTILHALRPEPRFGRLVHALGILTFTAGLLGTAVGVCQSAHYIAQVPREQQLEILAMGCEESLHNLVLALMLIAIAGLITVVTTIRGRGAGPTAG